LFAFLNYPNAHFPRFTPYLIKRCPASPVAAELLDQTLCNDYLLVAYDVLQLALRNLGLGRIINPTVII